MIELNDQEAQWIYDNLTRRRMYKPTDCPLGNPWADWMNDLLIKLKPLVKRTYD